MENSVGNMEKQFFFSGFQPVRIITVSEKRKVEQIYYRPRRTICVLKTYYNRDLSEVYQRLKSIRHENLVSVYDVLYCDGNTYVIEENIDGETLAEHLNVYGVLSQKEVIHIVEMICNALEQLHCQQPPLIHRDIKPSNVMLREDGTVKLIDFDTVRAYKEQKERDTVLLGTKEYASPEHYGYGQTDITSDIYSIGVMMNELLTGEMLDNHKATYKGSLLAVINRCIEVDSKRRFQTVKELRKMLSSYRTHWGFLFRNKKKMITGIILAAIIVAVTGVILERREEWPDLEAAYKEEISPLTLLENTKVDKKLEQLLGKEYSYVKECMYAIDSDVRYIDGKYFMSGGMPGLYSIMEAAITLTDDEEIECAFLQDGTCNYYATASAFYESPSGNMIEWMSTYEDYIIKFHEGEYNPKDESDISGTYTRTDSSAQITIEKTEEGTYHVKGFASWGINTGEIDGELEQINSQQFSYVESFGDEYKSELKIIAYEDKLFVETIQGVFGGLNVNFAGTYNKR